ncbi:GNAT family N-acetyltransferase [Clostridium sp. JS66]|uniref:GNAT family N-acetyltransferase n=1 Tax=Clostridium sp. JS66 TaxID=3064705 RepID=UPI00298D68E3|nr:GNAT family N-acetyltransferase [Clostridium sp. JS66]WPC43959.1 GNAT family N-acetyltransferase [Clostridium sp. JS66]
MDDNEQKSSRNTEEGINISIEVLEAKHEDMLLKIFKESRQDLTWISGITEEQKESIIAQQFMMEQQQLMEMYPEAQLNIITMDGKPIGRLYIYYGKTVDRILEIGLLEEYRGRGIGRKIVTTVVGNAVEKEKTVSLQVAWFNQGAYAFYEKLGFKVVENKGIAYEMKCIL